MIYQKIEERKLFSHEERKEILKSSYGKCACCGKKLTTKTMTVEHIIPISRGGTNENRNLVALCEPCNRRKGNLLCMASFYIALRDTRRSMEIREHINEWFNQVRDSFDIERYPMIAPVSFCQYIPEVYAKKAGQMPFLPAYIFLWSLIGIDYYEEIEAVTDLNLRWIRKRIRELWWRAEILKEYRIPASIPVAFYSFRKLSNDKILSVVAISYIKEKKTALIYVPWCIISKHNQRNLLLNLVSNLIETLEDAAGYDLDRYLLMTPYESVADQDYYMNVSSIYGKYIRGYMEYDEELDEPIYYLDILRRSQAHEFDKKMQLIRAEFSEQMTGSMKKEQQGETVQKNIRKMNEFST